MKFLNLSPEEKIFHRSVDMYEERIYKREANKKTKGLIKTKTFKNCVISIFLKRYKTSKAVTVKRKKN
ncbi:hypothetical protein THER_1790 [Thermodesulfovibrio sp. N1]|nr:hypothetical protein THER_1790 [Thermodesulfovibrio sp. N1]